MYRESQYRLYNSKVFIYYKKNNLKHVFMNGFVPRNVSHFYLFSTRIDSKIFCLFIYSHCVTLMEMMTNIYLIFFVYFFLYL